MIAAADEEQKQVCVRRDAARSKNAQGFTEAGRACAGKDAAQSIFMDLRVARDVAAGTAAGFDSGQKQPGEVGVNLLFGKERHVVHRRILISRGDRLTGYPRRKPVGKRKEHLENIEEGTNQLPSVIRANSGRVRADRGSLRAEVGTVGAAVPSACAKPV